MAPSRLQIHRVGLPPLLAVMSMESRMVWVSMKVIPVSSMLLLRAMSTMDLGYSITSQVELNINLKWDQTNGTASKQTTAHRKYIQTLCYHDDAFSGTFINEIYSRGSRISSDENSSQPYWNKVDIWPCSLRLKVNGPNHLHITLSRTLPQSCRLFSHKLRGCQQPGAAARVVWTLYDKQKLCSLLLLLYYFNS